MSGANDTPPKEGQNNVDVEYTDSFGSYNLKTKEIKLVSPLLTAIGKTQSLPKKPAYNENPNPDPSGNHPFETARDKFAPRAEESTIAGEDVGPDLPSVLAASGAAAFQSLPSMVKLLNLVKGIMQANNGSSSMKKVKLGLTDALIMIANKYGFDIVISVLDNCLANGGIYQLDDNFQQMVKQSLTDLIVAAVKSGNANKIPVTPFPVIVYGSSKPTVIYLKDNIPDMYIQQYYTIELDPYPGYIQWLGPSGDYIYSLRTVEDLPYTSAEEDVKFTAQSQLIYLLSPFFAKVAGSTTRLILTATTLNTILETVFNTASSNSYDKSMGKNSSSNVMSLLTKLLGTLAPVISQVQSSYLPKSILNTGAINASLQIFSKNIGNIKKMKSQAAGAFLNGSVPNLSSIGGITSALGSIPGIAQVTSIGQALTQVGMSSNVEAMANRLTKTINGI